MLRVTKTDLCVNTAGNKHRTSAAHVYWEIYFSQFSKSDDKHASDIEVDERQTSELYDGALPGVNIIDTSREKRKEKITQAVCT